MRHERMWALGSMKIKMLTWSVIFFFIKEHIP